MANQERVSWSQEEKRSSEPSAEKMVSPETWGAELSRHIQAAKDRGWAGLNMVREQPIAAETDIGRAEKAVSSANGRLDEVGNKFKASMLERVRTSKISQTARQAVLISGLFLGAHYAEAQTSDRQPPTDTSRFAVNSYDRARDDVKTKKLVYFPGSSWKFDEAEDSVLAKNNSELYPGLVECYIKNDRGEGYRLYQYEDKDGNVITPPDSLQKAIDLEKRSLMEYDDSETWAKKQFEYQKTPAWAKEFFDRYINSLKGKINDLKDKQEMLKDSPDYSEDDRKIDLKDQDLFERAIDYANNHPQEIQKMGYRSFAQLVDLAKGYTRLAAQHIADYQEKLDKVREYINQNK